MKTCSSWKVVAVFVLLVAPWGSSQVAAGGLKEKIVFDRDWDIWMVNPDGTGLEQLPDPLGIFRFQGAPKLSPDGCYLAFTALVSGSDYSDIWKMDLRTRTPTKLTNTPALSEDSADWSPDGAKLVYTRYAVSTGPVELWTMNADGSDPHSLTGGHCHGPAWSLDGSEILFAQLSTQYWQLYRINADGSDERPYYPYVTGCEDGWPRQRPIGNEIVFVSTRDDPGNDDPQLFTLPYPDALLPTRATPECITPLMDRRYGAPSWSPDGKHIVYVRASLHTWADCDLWVMDADGGNAHGIVVTPGSAENYPDWGYAVPEPGALALLAAGAAGLAAVRRRRR